MLGFLKTDKYLEDRNLIIIIIRRFINLQCVWRMIRRRVNRIQLERLSVTCIQDIVIRARWHDNGITRDQCVLSSYSIPISSRGFRLMTTSCSFLPVNNTLR